MNARPGQVARAQRAIRQAPDTRAMHRELRDGNPYVRQFLARRGLTYTPQLGIHRERKEAPNG